MMDKLKGRENKDDSTMNSTAKVFKTDKAMK
jgi:hypothetical protein